MKWQIKIIRFFKEKNYFALKDCIDKFYSKCIVSHSRWPRYPIYWKERQLFVRIKENTRPTNSAVFSHKELCKNCQKYNNIFNCFDVIKFCKSRNVLLPVEAIMI